MGGLTMALFRIMIVKCPIWSHVVIGMDYLLWILISFHVVFTFILVEIHHMSVIITKLAASNDFCYGYNPMMSEMIRIHDQSSESTMEEGLFYRRLAIGLGSGAFLTQVVIYVVLIFHLYQHDKEAVQKGVIHQDVRSKRNEKNVITLTGNIIYHAKESMFDIDDSMTFQARS